MTQEEAIRLLVQVAHLAQKCGVLTLSDAIQVAKAIDTVQPQNAEMRVADVGGGVLVSPRTSGDGRPKK